MDFTIGNPATGQSCSLNGMVDTGAAYSTVPEPVLEDLGIEQEIQSISSWPGAQVALAVGWVTMELDRK